ncbi:MAG: cyclopropane-fatty-acyl-phospholipid synthase family protein [Pseudomonadota bacterium]
MDGNTADNAVVVTHANMRTVAKGMPMLARAALKTLLDIEKGTLTVQFPNGVVIRIDGKAPGANARINLRSFDLAKRVVTRGDVGVGESFMDGEWDSPDVASVLLLFCENRHLTTARQRKFWSNLLLKFVHWRNENTQKGSKRNISAHYDLGNAFYKSWLDRTMTYSSALFENRNMSLEDAQTAKYANLARQTQIRPDDHVLEIGCGWGGFAEFAAKEIGCKVTGLTISQEQLEFAQKRIFEAGLNEKVDIVFRDYREERGHYDRIASIEMFEAVGEKYWPVYFDTLRERLKPGGAAGLQVITIRDDMFESYRSKTDFIQRYIFPGGMLPSPGEMVRLGQERGLTMSAERIFGHDYADTLAAWCATFKQRWADIKPLGFDERFKRMWEFYFYFCEAGFRSENIDVRQMVFAKR